MKAAKPYAPSADGAELLDDVRTFIARFVAFPTDAALIAVTLWAVMTHVADNLYTSPRLALLSPEPGSGKTRVLEVLATIVVRAMLSFSASAAAIFRTLAIETRTLLIDEADAVFTKRGKDDGNEDIRALLNVGYRRGATIPRCVGPRHEVQMFDVFSPAALAGLGDLPDTIMSRSIIVRMRRRAPGERVEQFRLRIHEPQGAKLQEALAAWGEAHGGVIGEAWPDLPEGVVDRDAEVWEPLLAVADAAGGHWPATARAACLEMLKVASEREVSLGVRLLGDLREVFGERDAMATADVLEGLAAIDEAPWGDLYGKPIESRMLARMLKRYGVNSTTVKIAGKALRGYRRETLWDTWERYLTPVSAEAQPPQPDATGVTAGVPNTSGEVAQQRSRSATDAQPEQPTLVAEVAPVVQPTAEAQPQTRVPDALPAEVAEVAPPREPGRSLTERAAHVAVTLLATPSSELDAHLKHQLVANHAPDWWRTTSATEPVAVLTALRLIAEDRQAGDLAGAAPAYLAAAREAIAAAGSRA